MIFTNQAHWKPYGYIENNQTNSNGRKHLQTIVFKSEINTLLLFKVWFSLYRFCIQSNLYVYSLKENHIVGYDLEVVKHYMLSLIYGTDWNLLAM